jgi:hypothetical protein
MLAMVVLLDNEAESVQPHAAIIAGAVHGRCGDRQPVLVESP